MKTKTNTLLSALLLASILLLNSCKKEETVITKNRPTLTKAEEFKLVAEKQLFVNNRIVHLQDAITRLVANGNMFFKAEVLIDDLDCATVVKDTTVYPHMAYFSFGPTGCTGSDGVHYSGSITMEYTDETLETTGTSCIITFDNFLEDSMLTNGTVYISNDGYNVSGNPIATVNFNVSTTLSIDAVSFNGNNTFYLEGVLGDPNDELDNYVLFTGGGSVNTSNGETYTQTITNPLMMKDRPECYTQFVSGSILMQSATSPDRLYDYGNGDCDNIGTVTSSGLTETVTFD